MKKEPFNFHAFGEPLSRMDLPAPVVVFARADGRLALGVERRVKVVNPSYASCTVEGTEIVPIGIAWGRDGMKIDE